ncbi:MAG: hypothetical protein V4719_02495 [Planctomycetota bacterium]
MPEDHPHLVPPGKLGNDTLLTIETAGKLMLRLADYQVCCLQYHVSGTRLETMRGEANESEDCLNQLATSLTELKNALRQSFAKAQEQSDLLADLLFTERQQSVIAKFYDSSVQWGGRSHHCYAQAVFWLAVNVITSVKSRKPLNTVPHYSLEAIDDLNQYLQREQDMVNDSLWQQVRSIASSEFSNIENEAGKTIRNLPETDQSNRKWHTEDFCSIVWDEDTYEFSPTQAGCVKYLWEQWEAGNGAVNQLTILHYGGSGGSRLDKVFMVKCTGSKKSVAHKAWGTLIVKGDVEGSFKLNGPRQPRRS